MDCPVCHRELQHLDAGGVSLDVCRGGCGGIWFDNHELQKFDEAHEHPTSAVFEVDRGPQAGAPGPASASDGALAKLSCPRCPGQRMQRHFFSVKRQIEVDECLRCGGEWLDHGELQKIREEFASAAERKEAAKAEFDGRFGAASAEGRAPGAGDRARAFRYASIVDFLDSSS